MFIGICSRSQVSVYRTTGPLVLYFNDLGQGQEMTLTLINYIPSLTLLHLHVAISKSQAAINSKISIA